MEGSLHVHPGAFPGATGSSRSQRAGPTAGGAVTASQCGCPGAPGCLRPSHGSQVERHLLQSCPPGREESALSVPPDALSQRHTPRPSPTRPAHLSELPGVPPRPRPPRAPLPHSGSPRVRSPAAGVAVGVAGRGRSLEGPRSSAQSPPQRWEQRRAGCVRTALARRAARGQAQEMTSAAAASHRGARPGPPGGLAARCDPQTAWDPRRDAHQTGPSLRGRRSQRVSSHL